ncbi:MAG: hypothetical protein ABI970_20170, partial [Chloroflexota bacterium]
ISSKTAALIREQQQQQQKRQLETSISKQLEQTQKTSFREGDRVLTPDGRTGTIDKISSMENPVMAKVRFGPGASETQYFILTDLKEGVDPTKEVFRVGDIVFSARVPGKEGRIEQINGPGAMVRYGSGKQDYYVEPLSKLMSPKALALQRDHDQQELKQPPIRAAFKDESEPFMRGEMQQMWQLLASAFNPKYRQVGITGDPKPAEYEALRKNLEALSVVCQKYPTMTNPDLPDYMQDNIVHSPADVCKIAEQRVSMIKKLHIYGAEGEAKQVIQRGVNQINSALRNEKGYVPDDVQVLLYDRAAWDQENLQKLRKSYAEAGEKMPPDLLAALDAKVAELKAKIESEAPTRSWTQPPYSDAALEATVRRMYPEQFPGVKVFKTGMDFSTWKKGDDTSVIASGRGYEVLKTVIGAYQYKVGVALVKMPNQPFCQIRDFVANQSKAGGGYGASKVRLPIGGNFVKCP